MQSIEMTLMSALAPGENLDAGRKGSPQAPDKSGNFAGALDRGARKLNSRESHPLKGKGSSKKSSQEVSGDRDDDRDQSAAVATGGENPVPTNPSEKPGNVSRTGGGRKKAEMGGDGMENGRVVPDAVPPEESAGEIAALLTGIPSELLAGGVAGDERHAQKLLSEAVAASAASDISDVSDVSAVEVQPQVRVQTMNLEVDPEAFAGEGETHDVAEVGKLIDGRESRTVVPEGGGSADQAEKIVEGIRAARVARREAAADRETENLPDRRDNGKVAAARVRIEEKGGARPDLRNASPEPGTGPQPGALENQLKNSAAAPRRVSGPHGNQREAVSVNEPAAGGSSGRDVQVQSDNAEKGLPVADLLRKDYGRSDRQVLKSSGNGGEAGTMHLQGQARQKRIVFSQANTSPENHTSNRHHETLADAGEEHSFAGISKEGGDTHFLIREAAGSDSKGKIVSHSGETQLQGLVTRETLSAENLSGTEKSSLNSSDFRNYINDDSVIDQVRAGLPERLKASQSVTIKLWPENLGKVDIRLTLRGQQLAATFMVEQSEVKDAMLRKIDSLRDGLQVRGIDVKGIEIKVVHARPGEGPNVGVGDQQLNNFASQQNGSNAFAHTFSSPSRSYVNEGGEIFHEPAAEELVPAGPGEMAMEPGSLNIMA